LHAPELAKAMHQRSVLSGGVRVIYYFKRSQHQIWMLTLYPKSEQATIPSHLLKKIAEPLKNE
jgi:hypothetical protein